MSAVGKCYFRYAKFKLYIDESVELKISIDVVLMVANKQLVQQIAIMGYFTVLQSNPTSNLLKKCVFVSNEEFCLSLTLLLRLHKYQFVNNRLLFFTIQSKMGHKTGGNQIHDRGLDKQQLKTQSLAVEMF